MQQNNNNNNNNNNKIIQSMRIYRLKLVIFYVHEESFLFLYLCLLIKVVEAAAHQDPIFV